MLEGCGLALGNRGVGRFLKVNEWAMKSLGIHLFNFELESNCIKRIHFFCCAAAAFLAS
jgi:hypothetical protein